MKLASLLAYEKTTIEAKQETQDKINLWIKDNIYALGKIGWIYNKIIQLEFDATWLSLKA